MGVWGAALQGVMGVDSAIQGGMADKKQADANTKLANDAAADSLIRASRDAGAVRSAGSQVAAQQFVAFTNSGVDASVGTAANVIASTDAQSELAALTVENNAAREAWGYKKHGIAFQTQAGINSARTNREIAGTALGALGQGMSAYAKDKAGGGSGFGF